MRRGKTSCIAAVLLSALLFQGAANGETPDGWVNLEIDPGWNLIGHSAETAVNISTLTFTNTSGSTTTWANTVSQNKVYGYFAYYDSSPTLAKNRKFKYAATSGVDSTTLTADTGYWLNARQAGTLTLPSVGGTLNTSTYAWSQLRFHNGSEELNITGAGSENWIITTMKYWNPNLRGGTDFDTITTGNLNSWQGYFIWSYYDNITLIRRN